MKVAILVGGCGSRLSEETEFRPKPLVEIGGRPLLWHIMMHYDRFGYGDFALALGYKGELIKHWFREATLLNGNVRIHTQSGQIDALSSQIPDWQVELIETGQSTNTGGRIKALEPYIGRERFMLTWGDGVSDVDLDALLKFHIAHGKLATVTAVRPLPRFGHLSLEGDMVSSFEEKPEKAEGWINGAFFVLEPAIFDRIGSANTHFEGDTLQRLARDGELMAYKHEGFWQCMDTLHDKNRLEGLWKSGSPPWVTWDQKQQ